VHKGPGTKQYLVQAKIGRGAFSFYVPYDVRRTTWPIQDSVLFLGLCARINTILFLGPTLCLGTPPHPVIAHTIAQYNVSPRQRVLAFTRYCKCQYCVVSIATTGGRGETLYCEIVRAMAWWGGVPKDRVGAEIKVLIRAQNPRNKTISCIGQYCNVYHTILAMAISCNGKR